VLQRAARLAEGRADVGRPAPARLVGGAAEGRAGSRGVRPWASSVNSCGARRRRRRGNSVTCSPSTDKQRVSPRWRPRARPRPAAHLPSRLFDLDPPRPRFAPGPADRHPPRQPRGWQAGHRSLKNSSRGCPVRTTNPNGLTDGPRRPGQVFGERPDNLGDFTTAGPDGFGLRFGTRPMAAGQGQKVATNGSNDPFGPGVELRGSTTHRRGIMSERRSQSRRSKRQGRVPDQHPRAAIPCQPNTPSEQSIMFR
jgi:hypothetical protein